MWRVLSVCIIFQPFLVFDCSYSDLSGTQPWLSYLNSTYLSTKHTGNQLYNFWSWKSIALLAFNPVLHWIMGNSLVINQGATAMYPMQVRSVVILVINIFNDHLPCPIDNMADAGSVHYRCSRHVPGSAPPEGLPALHIWPSTNAG